MTPLNCRCQICGAKRGQPCRTPSRTLPYWGTHKERGRLRISVLGWQVQQAHIAAGNHGR